MATSRVACASFNIGSSTTITINRDKSSYTHTLTYSFNGATGTIVTKTTQTSYIWNPPAATLYSKIPNATSGYGTVTCQTYDGNTLIGSKTAGFYAYAVKANCIPTVTATIVDTNAATIAVTGSSSKLVRYISKPKVTMTATAKNSATISSRQIYNPVGLTATTSPYTFDTVYDKDWRCTATDSRGYSKTTEYDLGANFIEYDPCYFTSYAIKRTESTSTTATATLKGYCFKGSFGSVSNTLNVKYRYKVGTGAYGSYTNIGSPTWNTDGTFTATVNITGLALTNKYTFEFVVEDKLSSFPTDEGVVLGEGTGDFRIGKDYVLAKNSMIVGSTTETNFKSFRARRVVNNVQHFTEYGVSNIDNMAGLIMQLYKKVGTTSTRLARYDIREDGFMYNYQTAMSVAEIMSSAPSMGTSGNQGFLLLNGGDSSTPILVQWGRINKVPSGANVATPVEINFLYAYSSQPVIFVGSVHNLSVDLDVSTGTPTTTGTTLYIKRANTSNSGMFWISVGNGTASLPAA